MTENHSLEYLLTTLLEKIGKLLEESEKGSVFLKKDKRLNIILNKFKNPFNTLNEINKSLKTSSFFKKEVSENENNQLLNKEIAREEEILLKEKKKVLEHIEKISSDEDDLKDGCIIEIRHGVGGVESCIFVSDLYQMYFLLAAERNWTVKMIRSKAGEKKGISSMSFSIKGKDCYQMLKNESGIHRVQRIPETESKGRIQTSTVSVVVISEISDINPLNIKIDPKDIKIDTYRSSGAGGQHVNTTDSAIRITHIPTQIVSTSQDGRSQADNKEKAMAVLRSRIYEKELRERSQQLGNIRNSAIGNSERSEKIRTYNYQQNRITDHRIEKLIDQRIEKFEVTIRNESLGRICEKLNELLEIKEKKQRILDLIDYLEKKI